MEALDELGVREQRLVYLVTYSRADLEKAPTRESFAEAVTVGWMQTTGVRVQQWVVAREMHANMTDSTSCNIFHYHMALKIEKRTRWLSVRNWLDEKYGMKVNFSSHHKEDAEFAVSHGHPDHPSAIAPRTEKAISSNKQKRKAAKGSSGKEKKGRKRGLSVYDVAEYIQTKKIKSKLQLMSIAAEQNREGKRDLAMFICNRGSKTVDEYLAIASELACAEEKYARSQKNSD